MAELKANSVVQLLGTNKTGRILSWTEELSRGHRDLCTSHFAIRPIDKDDSEFESVVYWPRSQVCLIEPSPQPDEDFKFRF